MLTRSLKVCGLVLSGILLSGSHVVAAGPQMTQPQRRSLAAQVQTLFGVPENGPGFLPQLADCIAAPAADRASLLRSVDKMADALLAGGPPDELSRMTTAGATLTHPVAVQRSPGWKYGLQAARMNLAKLMWAQASGPDTPESRRPVLAKAALLLATQEDFLFGDVSLRTICRDTDAYAKYADLRPEQKAVLIDLVTGLKAAIERQSGFMESTIKAEAVLISAPGGPLPAADVSREIESLKSEWEAPGTAPGLSQGMRYFSIVTAWDLRNLCRERNDPTAQSVVERLLSDWASQHWSPAVDQWLAQSLTTSGPAPKRSRIIGPAAPKQ